MRVRRSEEQWRKLFALFEESGLTREAFCKKNELSLATFDNWRRRVRAAAAPARFVEVRLPQQNAPLQVEEPASLRGDLVVELPYGVVLRFRGLGQ